jgi:hypothetical protein
MPTRARCCQGDYMIKRDDRGVQEKGPQFKVEDKKRPQLFLGEQRAYRFALS